MRMYRTVIALACASAALAVTAPAGAEPEEASPSVMGWFEGEWIRLADGWGDAHACTSDDDKTARCYRSEAEMDAAEGPFPEPVEAGEFAARAACSGVLRLYTLTNHGGDVLQLSAQFQYLNLSSYGFSNVTSSYRIGPCNSNFYDTWPNTGTYPGSTAAFASATSMVSGWDNRIGSVYIS